jgi:hypothetical protein
MPTCLFCLRKDAVHYTDEHVFPAALGGTLVVRDGSCDVCNHGNSKFEQALAVELRPIRMLLQIPDRYGNVPHTSATLITPTETYEGRVKSDGSVVPKPIITIERNAHGEREFVHRFMTEATREKLREEAKRKGKQLIETGPGEPVVAEVHIGGDLMIVGSKEGLQTVAKVAYIGLAHLMGSRIATGDAFAIVRDFIQRGSPKGVARIFVNTDYLEACPQGPHQHSIAIAARRDLRRVDAIVRLFGELTYFVVLSERYEGVDFFNTLVFDAYRGEENGILFGHVQAELLQTQDVATSKKTMWDDLESFGKNFCDFLNKMWELKLRKDYPDNTEGDDLETKTLVDS